MNAANLQLAEQLVNAQYVRQGAQVRHARESLLASLLAQRRMPEVGWDETSIELLLHELAGMDSNNFPGNTGVGEREGRLLCPLVAHRHYRLAHGIGRSGDIAEVQPKAAGSSLLVKLANALALDLLRRAGAPSFGAALVLPMATGMSIALVLLALRKQRPSATHVLWPRLDQKACLKAIILTGLTPEVIDGCIVGEQIETDMDALQARLDALGSERVLCVLSSTSCFAPRAPDKLLPIARLCDHHGVPHVVNNAYGVQARPLMRMIDAAAQNGRVDAVVQSTDKNLGVPVGGAIIAAVGKGPGAAASKALLKAIGGTYAGRASIAPIVDAFCTMLYLGAEGYAALVVEREANMLFLAHAVGTVARAHGERLIVSGANPISIAVTLGVALGARELEAARPGGADAACAAPPAAGGGDGDGGGGGGGAADAAVRGPGAAASGPATAASGSGRRLEAAEYTAFGARLFQRLCSGARVVVPTERKVIDGVELLGFGAHVRGYPSVYFTVAAALGQSRAEIELFAKRLDAVFVEFERASRAEARGGVGAAAVLQPRDCAGK